MTNHFDSYHNWSTNTIESRALLVIAARVLEDANTDGEKAEAAGDVSSSGIGVLDLGPISIFAMLVTRTPINDKTSVEAINIGTTT